jgi:hypothetical protein
MKKLRFEFWASYKAGFNVLGFMWGQKFFNLEVLGVNMDVFWGEEK